MYSGCIYIAKTCWVSNKKFAIGLKPLMLIGIMMRFSLTKEGSVVNYGSIDGQSELTLEPAHVHE